MNVRMNHVTFDRQAVRWVGNWRFPTDCHVLTGRWFNFRCPTSMGERQAKREAEPAKLAEYNEIVAVARDRLDDPEARDAIAEGMLAEIEANRPRSQAIISRAEKTVRLWQLQAELDIAPPPERPAEKPPVDVDGWLDACADRQGPESRA